VKPAPSRLAPVFVPRIWGARSLAPLFDMPSDSEPIGEVWLTGDRCAFASGPLAGRTLSDVWPSLPAEWTGTRLQATPRIPLLVKFLFPEDKLSVQVHPNDAYAREHEAAAGGVGKTEMWYAIAARDGAEICLGLKPSATPESFRRAIDDGTVEHCLKRFTVRAGDAFFVPAGAAHTIGPGMVLCEVQQHSDLTYRVFDYNRLQADGKPRPLHIRQALDVMQFGEQSGGHNGRKVEPVRIHRGSLQETYFAACRYFATEHWEFSERITAASSPENFELLILLSGRGRIEWGSDSAAYGPAEVWMLPAALGSYRLAPQSTTKLLRTYVPDLREFAERLAGQQIEEALVSRVVYR
jgi:mannose-6-phosphate isomerase